MVMLPPYTVDTEISKVLARFVITPTDAIQNEKRKNSIKARDEKNKIII
jgi:hypothetical protein